MITKLMQKHISALSIHLTTVKTWNRIYKCWVNYIITLLDALATEVTQPHEITSYTLNRLNIVKAIYTKIVQDAIDRCVTIGSKNKLNL